MGYIYKITNKINGKAYVGQTSRPVEIRIKEHFSSKLNDSLHRDIQTLGKDNFQVDILFYDEDGLEYLDTLESRYIAEENSYHYGYNNNGGPCGDQRDVIVKEKIIDAIKMKFIEEVAEGGVLPEEYGIFERTIKSLRK